MQFLIATFIVIKIIHYIKTINFNNTNIINYNKWQIFVYFEAHLKFLQENTKYKITKTFKNPSFEQLTNFCQYCKNEKEQQTNMKKYTKERKLRKDQLNITMILHKWKEKQQKKNINISLVLYIYFKVNQNKENAYNILINY